MIVVATAISAQPASAKPDDKPSKQVLRALSLTPEHFQATSTLKDDSLETVATITTLAGFQYKRGLLKIVHDDNFLRAFIDKKSGETRFQLYQIISYGGSWRFYSTANYETLEGPKSVDLTVVDRDVSCSRYGCSYTEHVAFDVEGSLLRTVAEKYRPNEEIVWRFKFKSKAGTEWPDGLLPAEAAGLLAAVDAYKRAQVLPLP